MNNEPNLKIKEELLVIFKSGKISELLKRVISIEKKFPKSIFILNLLGSIQNELQNYEEAIINFKKIIKIKPDFADAHYNLGIIYKKLNQIDNSIYHYECCIKINPNKYEAFNNLGNVYKDKQETQLAIENYLKCLEKKPNYLIALQNFGVCLQNFKFTKQSLIVEKHIINLLEKNKILRPVDIVKSLINYLYLDKKFTEIIENFGELRKNYILENLINDVLNFKILIQLLKITQITDIKIEKVLRHLRSDILLNISLIKNKGAALKLLESIAAQCFINEYIYPIELNEKNALNKIKQKIKEGLLKGNLKKLILEISCLATFEPLSTFDWSNKIINNEELSSIVVQQIVNPKKEINLKKTINSNQIKNHVSLKVKDQYENNPYPRWEKIALASKPKKVINFFNNLDLKINEKNIKNWNKVDVLVAGCGTGQHAITTATKYKNSYITAIDLSASSLSYAKRKADELEIENIEFIQMDLLDLKNFGKKFDIIESVGVLHHMEDPLNGWKILNDILNTNGMMMIGLYSKIARQHIERIRNDIIKINIEANYKNIINFREKIILSKNDDYNLIKESPDFYSLSNLRDLLFHVQEKRFTITEIENILNKLNLKFCGFENNELLKFFKVTHTKKKDLYDLKLWNNFELNNPRIFAGMYQFWCQKV